MDLLTLEPVDGRVLAARGDWHAAAAAFDSALADAERDTDSAPRATRNARLAAVLTNLGQARAYLGALDDAAVLLARSAALREALVEGGHAGPPVAARGLIDLAAVHAAAGDALAALHALERARTLLGDADPALAAQIDDGLRLLGG